MMMFRSMLMVAFVVAVTTLCGCSGPGTNAESVDMKGVVQSADGQPIANVQLVLQPMGAGFTSGGLTGADGSFTAKGIPGDYMFFFQPSESAKSAADQSKSKGALAAIPEKYKSANVENKITLSAGAGNKVTVTK